MTDHTRLCELLEGAVFANSDDHWDAQGIMRRLRSNGPDALRVVNPEQLAKRIQDELVRRLRAAGGERD